jgi:hypothetical protein
MMELLLIAFGVLALLAIVAVACYWIKRKANDPNRSLGGMSIASLTKPLSFKQWVKSWFAKK